MYSREIFPEINAVTPMIDINNFEDKGFQLNDKSYNSPDNLILIADDCPFNIVALQSLLLQFNLTSDIATNGLEATQQVKDRHKATHKPMYKLILMDFSMPECDGPGATQNIRLFLEKQNLSQG